MALIDSLSDLYCYRLLAVVCRDRTIFKTIAAASFYMWKLLLVQSDRVNTGPPFLVTHHGLASIVCQRRDCLRALAYSTADACSSQCLMPSLGLSRECHSFV